MKREELLIFYSFWLRCFVVMMQYVGFLGRSQLFGSQVKVGAPTWHLARAKCIVGAPTAKLARQVGAPTLELARAKSRLRARQLPHSSSSFAPFMHSLSLLGISLYYASKATQRKRWGEVIRSDNLDWGLYNKKFSVWESSWTKQRGYIENKGVFVQAEQGSQGM